MGLRLPHPHTRGIQHTGRPIVEITRTRCQNHPSVPYHRSQNHGAPPDWGLVGNHGTSAKVTGDFHAKYAHIGNGMSDRFLSRGN